MPIRVACAACGKKLVMPENLTGKKPKCPACGASLSAEDEPQPVPEQTNHATTARTTISHAETKLPATSAPRGEPEEDNPFAEFRATANAESKPLATPPVKATTPKDNSPMPARATPKVSLKPESQAEAEEDNPFADFRTVPSTEAKSPAKPTGKTPPQQEKPAAPARAAARAEPKVAAKPVPKAEAAPGDPFAEFLAATKAEPTASAKPSPKPQAQPDKSLAAARLAPNSGAKVSVKPSPQAEGKVAAPVVKAASNVEPEISTEAALQAEVKRDNPFGEFGQLSSCPPNVAAKAGTANAATAKPTAVIPIAKPSVVKPKIEEKPAPAHFQDEDDLKPRGQEKRSRRKNPQRKSAPTARLWIGVGVAVGILLAVGVVWTVISSSPKNAAATAQNSPKRARPTNDPKKAVAKQAKETEPKEDAKDDAPEEAPKRVEPKEQINKSEPKKAEPSDKKTQDAPNPAPANEAPNVMLGGIKIYFGDGATKEDADRLGAYLFKIASNPQVRQDYQIKKAADTFQVRVPTRRETALDKGFVSRCAFDIARISREALQGAAVELHLCDDRLTTLTTIPIRPDMRFSVMEGGDKVEMFYASETDKADAVKVAQFYDKAIPQGARATVKLARRGPVTEVHMMVQKGLLNDAEIATWQKARAAMAAQIFMGAVVEIHFCDELLAPFRVIGP